MSRTGVARTTAILSTTLLLLLLCLHVHVSCHPPGVVGLQPTDDDPRPDRQLESTESTLGTRLALSSLCLWMAGQAKVALCELPHSASAGNRLRIVVSRPLSAPLRHPSGKFQDGGCGEQITRGG
jgi:hypothetical protein